MEFWLKGTSRVCRGRHTEVGIVEFGLNEAKLKQGGLVKQNARDGDESVSLWIAWFASHDVVIRLFVGERHSRHDVCTEVDAQDSYSAEWQWDADQHVQQERHDLRYIARQRVRYRLAQIVEDSAS